MASYGRARPRRPGTAGTGEADGVEQRLTSVFNVLQAVPGTAGFLERLLIAAGEAAAQAAVASPGPSPDKVDGACEEPGGARRRRQGDDDEESTTDEEKEAGGGGGGRADASSQTGLSVPTEVDLVLVEPPTDDERVTRWGGNDVMKRVREIEARALQAQLNADLKRHAADWDVEADTVQD